MSRVPVGSNNFFDVPPPTQSHVVARPSRGTEADSDPEEEAMPEISMQTIHRRGSRGTSGSLSNTFPKASGHAEPPLSASMGFTEPGPRSGADQVGARLATVALEEPEDAASVEFDGMSSGGGRAARAARMHNAGSSALPPPRFGAAPAPAAPPPAAPAPARRPAPQPAPRAAPAPPLASSGSPGGGHPARPAAAPARRAAPGAGTTKELLLESDNFDDEDYGDDTGAAGAMGGSIRIGGRTAAPTREPVPQTTAQAMKELLWGAQGGPPLSWKQGFFFNEKRGLRFGLVQEQGGPCGVLAAVQAQILVQLSPDARSGGRVNTDPSAQQQQAALVDALTEILWACRGAPDASAFVVLPPPRAGESPSSLSHEELIRGVAFVHCGSREAVADVLRASLSTYMEPPGWGVVLLLLSVLLTRGVHVVRGDMDEKANALMGMHGYCTQEMVNLLVSGRSVSNVHDGEIELDGTTLRGIDRPCRVGLLTIFEWYKYIEVGSRLKRPQYPVWVVCSESHFTVLFAEDGAAVAGAPPFDLFYYDELANQDSVIRLSVAPDPAGGWTARVGDSFGDRGKCEGQNIPPLECVIETRWPGVKVNWNGAEPIL
ncbi:hypothetical protein FOA52_003499 [Chlamydomonas sp. UWO 241]|nr:hypothetical protein FOA52_003499 [Chlamydomonas sp. UWO 241]